MPALLTAFLEWVFRPEFAIAWPEVGTLKCLGRQKSELCPDPIYSARGVIVEPSMNGL
jgi:hypothetical protein